jgi:hypothetical protein
MTLHTTITKKRLGDLLPDPKNPRFPEDQREALANGDEIFDYLADAFDALLLAESIARHGYFASEPMIVMAHEERWLVLEGNRRLTALYGLARPDLREQFDNQARWDDAAEEAKITLDFEVPTLIADAREDADAVIGFRHIGSVLEWKPLQRARFLAYLVDDRQETFLEAADSVGEDESVVRMLYRNQGIIVNARELDQRDLAARATDRFGIFTAALNRTSLRDYIGAKPVPQVEERVRQLDEDSLPQLVELGSWLFGSNGDERVIRESRQLTMLAKVVADDRARDELQRTRDLEGAFAVIAQTITPEPARLMRQFATGVGHIRSVASHIEVIAAETRTSELAAELSELSGEITDSLPDD